jgi:ATP-dependent DNA helicase RecG
MTNTAEIEKLIQSGENELLEFESNFNNELIETLVAFANTSGGQVVIGINQNKTVVIFSIQEYPIKPVATRGKYFKRFANSNHLMSVDEIANEHLKTTNTSWDFYPDPNHSTEHISARKVKRFVETIEQRTQKKIKMPHLDFLAKLEIIRGYKLTFGGYLLFVKEYCLISDIQVGRFKSPTTIIDSISLNTDLFTEIDEIIAFIKKHLMVEYIITGAPQCTERSSFGRRGFYKMVKSYF